MRATLQFDNLSDHDCDQEFRDAINGSKYRWAIDRMLLFMRDRNKYDSYEQEGIAELEALRAEFYEILEHYDVLEAMR